MRVTVLLAYPLPLGDGALAVSPGGRLFRLELRQREAKGKLDFGPEREMACYLGLEGKWIFREYDPLPGLMPPSCRRLAFWLAANGLSRRPLPPGRLAELLSVTDGDASYLSALLLGGAARARRTPGGVEVRFRRLPPSLASFGIRLEDGEGDSPSDRTITGLPWPVRSRFDAETLSRCWEVPPPRSLAWFGRKAWLDRAPAGSLWFPLRPGPAARVMVRPPVPAARGVKPHVAPA